MNENQQLPEHRALELRKQIDQSGFAVADVGSRETYLEVCSFLGTVTAVRDIHVSPEDVQKFTGYSYKPDAVPFHTDYPFVNVVGLFCEEPDLVGGENLIIDCRNILNELSVQECDYLKSVAVPLPKRDETLPILSETNDQKPHIYWLPALALSNAVLSNFDEGQANAVIRFNEILLKNRAEAKYQSFGLNSGQALWFDNFVMLHGRDQIDASSKRLQVRTFIKYE